MTPVLLQKLLVILQRCLVEVRNLSLAGHHEQVYELAESFHEIPSLIRHWDERAERELRCLLEDYQSKHPGSPYDYLAILDMSKADFQAMYCPPYPDPVSMA